MMPFVLPEKDDSLEHEMGTLKDLISNCKVEGTAVQAFELFLYVAVKIWKRC